MHFIITSGATFEQWDDVRGITNRSQGKTGAKIAEEALFKGHTVDYISNKTTKKPFEIKANPNNLDEVLKLAKFKDFYSNYTFNNASTFSDYLNQCLKVPENKKMPVFISSAAVSDFSPKKINGKIKSNKEDLFMELEKLPKVIKEVKNKYPLMPIVGFKLLSEEDSTLNDLIEVAYKSLLDSRMALVVANLVDKNFRPTTTIIITPEKNIIPVERKDLPNKLVSLIESRLDKDYFKTLIKDSFPNNLNIEPLKDLVNECSLYSLFSSYGDGRKGAEFGSLAMRTELGIVTTGRGTTKKKVEPDNLTLINSIVDNNINISSNKIKATLNAPTLYYILENRKEINYVVHAHIYLPNGVFIEEHSSPGTKHDYDVIHKAVVFGENVINQVGHGCLILLENKSDLLNVLLENGLYNSPYSKYYDIVYHRFEKGILERTIESFNFDKKISVLDLACGTGKSSLELMKLGFVNLDIADGSKDMLSVAESRTKKKGIVTQFEDLSNINKKYDLITIRQAFSYCQKEKINDFIKGIKTCLNTGGYLLFNSFSTLEKDVFSRYDEFNLENSLIKTLETNIITDDNIIHSQRTEYLNTEDGTYLPLYDINIFNQLDFIDLEKRFLENGFEVDIIKKNKSVCFVARKK